MPGGCFTLLEVGVAAIYIAVFAWQMHQVHGTQSAVCSSSVWDQSV
jgi:hypothetical protein